MVPVSTAEDVAELQGLIDDIGELLDGKTVPSVMGALSTLLLASAHASRRVGEADGELLARVFEKMRDTWKCLVFAPDRLN